MPKPPKSKRRSRYTILRKDRRHSSRPSSPKSSRSSNGSTQNSPAWLETEAIASELHFESDVVKQKLARIEQNYVALDQLLEEIEAKVPVELLNGHNGEPTQEKQELSDQVAATKRPNKPR